MIYYSLICNIKIHTHTLWRSYMAFNEFATSMRASKMIVSLSTRCRRLCKDAMLGQPIYIYWRCRGIRSRFRSGSYRAVSVHRRAVCIDLPILYIQFADLCAREREWVENIELGKSRVHVSDADSRARLPKSPTVCARTTLLYSDYIAREPRTCHTSAICTQSSA